MSPTLSEKDRVRLRHMLDYAREAIQFASGQSKLDFLRERQLQLAVTHLIELVGEAANHISPETQAKYPQIPWPQVIGMRHRLIHGYDFLDYTIVWQTATADFPALVTALEAILAVDSEAD